VTTSSQYVQLPLKISHGCQPKNAHGPCMDPTSHKLGFCAWKMFSIQLISYQSNISCLLSLEKIYIKLIILKYILYNFDTKKVLRFMVIL